MHVSIERDTCFSPPYPDTQMGGGGGHLDRNGSEHLGANLIKLVFAYQLATLMTHDLMSPLISSYCLPIGINTPKTKTQVVAFI